MTKRVHADRWRHGEALQQRPAYTLLELIIVLTILVSLGALVWPRIQPMLERSTLTQAALQLKAELAEARERAVRSGEVWELRCCPGSNQYVVQPQKKLSSQLEGSDRDLRSSAEAMPVVPARELPDEVVFWSPDFDLPTAESGRKSLADSPFQPVDANNSTSMTATMAPKALAMPPEAPMLAQEEWPTVAQFRPNGRATEKIIKLIQRDDHQSIELQLRGFTGTVQIGSVQHALPADRMTQNESTTSADPQPGMTKASIHDQP